MIILSRILSEYSIEDVVPIEKMRNEYIRTLAKNLDTNELKSISEDLFNLGLTVYSKDYFLDSLIYNSVYKSKIDSKISLYPEQLKLIEKIKENEALIISAPTSFGKTFSVFEYIVEEQPKNVVMIVPTLALVDEYLRKIINKYKDVFRHYKKYINFDEQTRYNYDNYNIFILTHDKALENGVYKLIKEIDFLVIDEVYKLQNEPNNDRVLVLNLAYYYLAQKAKKYVLLAPFIKGVEDKERLEKKPAFFKTDFSPVVNEVIIKEIDDEKLRNDKTRDIITKIFSEKTLIYFPTVAEIPRFVKNEIVPNFPIINIQDVHVKKFINWIKNEIHEDWYLVKAMERGFLVHNGQLPSNGFRMYQMDLYEESKDFNLLFCTSTVLEGVNMCAKNIIITKPYRNDNAFDAFDFYNLVGRTGRLYKHYLGNAYYIKSPTDSNYNKESAIKSIKFEATENTEDFEFHTNGGESCEEYNSFLELLGIDSEDYKENIGVKYKIKTIKSLYESYKKKKKTLLSELNFLSLDEIRTRGILINIIHAIIQERDISDFMVKFQSAIINKLIDKRRLRLKSIINNIMESFPIDNIDMIISNTMRMKTSYIEHTYYSMTKIILFFMKCEKVENKFIEIINTKIISCIDYLYYSDSKCKKILKDLGIYEYDIDKITETIGNDLEDINQIVDSLKNNSFKRLNYISYYIINRL